MTRDELGKLAHSEFLRQMGGAFKPELIASSWDDRGEQNKEQWRKIAEAVADAVRTRAGPAALVVIHPTCLPGMHAPWHAFASLRQARAFAARTEGAEVFAVRGGWTWHDEEERTS